MLNLNGKSAVSLLLLGVVAGGLAITNASAMSKSTKKTLTSLQTKENKSTKTSKKIDSELDKVGVKNLNALMQNSNGNKISDTLNPALSTYKLSKATKVSVGGKTTVTLPKGSVVRGNTYTLNPKFPSRFAINVENLSKKNQGYVFKAFGNKEQIVNFSLASTGKAMTSYTKSTPFSYSGIQNLPNLNSKNLQSYYISDRKNNPFITVTADNYLNYYTNYQSGNNINYSKYSQSIKIKKLTRGSKNYTYYLAKPLAGFGTKRVRVGKSYQYKLVVSLGHVFRSYDNHNLDGGSYRMTVKVGTKSFYVDLGNIAAGYISKLKGTSDSEVNESAAKAYIQNLQ
ncbi:hypothetical protein [Levilactobacillus brevis]|uniref:hypothetical protein n=1 Tax=Levilactobacillus brevis TaxID=1580 RepID=UPI0011206E7C|nr:hypothetical protein [Levilactobacillus brevis]MUV40571.1 hypothetical protein [Levilactobacillus brevis]TOY76917.1 hypothetical protein DIS16_01085 [Levilactobacillus brevis]